jgi:thiol-disulfide isomerase/thioredoxin
MGKRMMILPMIVMFIACESNQEVQKQEDVPLFKVELTGKSQLDSIILYDKSNAWEVISTLRFSQSDIDSDTLKIDQSKILQMYTFTEGKQASFGEFIASDKKAITMQINTDHPFESRSYSGDYSEANNYLSFISFQQDKLSKSILDGLDTIILESSINLAQKSIQQRAAKVSKPDSIVEYSSEQFTKFTDILRKKNKKYIYKKELIGSNGLAFTLQDARGQSIDLSLYKGQYIYIDVWATWCKPCKEEYPFLTKLAKEYSEADLVVLSVSIDKEFDTWTKHLNQNKLDGVHLYTGADSEFVQFYDIGAIPRFILIDRDGKVVNSDEIRPSNSELKNYLDKLTQ